MYRALYRKWRPQRFEDVVAQRGIVTALRNQVASGRVGHAYLFTGVRGTGKTTCAKIFAKAVNCLHPHNGDPCGECEICKGIDNGSILDVVEMDAASNNGVDDIRDLRDETAYTPSACQYKVYIIDEVHMLSTAAFNALLKTLEEPPAHVIFILATTEIQKVPATILSRCQRYDFTRIGPEDIARRVEYIAGEEKLELTPDGAELIDRDALMVSAMLVDIAPEGTTFPAYNTKGSYVPKTITAGGAWMGGGLNNYDYAELNATDVSYKIIARGWMDLCNPDAGYDSASAGTKVALKVGENHDYTIYLQPNVYTVKEGHKLALVIYTYEPGKANYAQNYQITLENASVSAEIPVDQIPATAKLPFQDVTEGTVQYNAVEWAYNHAPRITGGVSADTFGTDLGCTRAHIVTFLYQLAGAPDVSGLDNPFADVAGDAYYCAAVKWAAANGITAGTSKDTFSPDAVCTRGQIILMLYRGEMQA